MKSEALNLFRMREISPGLLPLQDEIYGLVRGARDDVKQVDGHEGEIAKALFDGIESEIRRGAYGCCVAQLNMHAVRDVYKSKCGASKRMRNLISSRDERASVILSVLNTEVVRANEKVVGILDDICPSDSSKWDIWKRDDMKFAESSLQNCRGILGVYAKCGVCVDSVVSIDEALRKIEEAIELIQRTSYDEQLQLFDKRSMANQDHINRRMLWLNAAGIVISLLALGLSTVALLVQCSSSGDTEMIVDAIRSTDDVALSYS